MTSGGRDCRPLSPQGSTGTPKIGIHEQAVHLASPLEAVVSRTAGPCAGVHAGLLAGLCAAVRSADPDRVLAALPADLADRAGGQAGDVLLPGALPHEL